MLGLFQFKNNRNYSQEPSDEVQRHDSFCKVTIFFELLEINLPKNTFLTLNKMYGPFCVKMSHHTPFIEKTSYLCKSLIFLYTLVNRRADGKLNKSRRE